MPRSDKQHPEADPLPGLDLDGTARALLAAALDAFAERGFHAATTREIGARVNLSPAAVYVHFPTKVDLLYQISRYGHQAVLSEIDLAMKGLDAPEERLRAFAATMAAWHASHNTLARVIQYEMRALEPAQLQEVIELRRKFTSKMRDEVSRGARSGSFDPPDVRGTGDAILSLCIDVARWYRPESSRTPAQIGRLYGQLALRMVGSTDT